MGRAVQALPNKAHQTTELLWAAVGQALFVERRILLKEYELRIHCETWAAVSDLLHPRWDFLVCKQHLFCVYAFKMTGPAKGRNAWQHADVTF